MEHVIVKAAATATTDLGEFTAIAAAYTVDRVNDRIIPGAFKNTITSWQESGKSIPVHWNHEGDPKSIIGSINPASMIETDAGLYVEGKLDLDGSDIAREAWRSMKNNTMSLSFGYLVEKSRKATNGVTDLLEIDLFEISIVPAPANADTRVLSLKSADDAQLILKELEALRERLDRLEEAERKSVDEADKEPEKVRSVDPLRTRSDEVALEVVSGGLSKRKPPTPEAPEPEPELIPLRELKQRSRDLMLQVLSGTTETP